MLYYGNLGLWEFHFPIDTRYIGRLSVLCIDSTNVEAIKWNKRQVIGYWIGTFLGLAPKSKNVASVSLKITHRASERIAKNISMFLYSF